MLEAMPSPPLTLMHSDRPKLYTILAFLSATGLSRFHYIQPLFITLSYVITELLVEKDIKLQVIQQLLCEVRTSKSITGTSWLAPCLSMSSLIQRGELCGCEGKAYLIIVEL